MSIPTILLVVLAVLVLWVVVAFNSLIRLRNRVREAWADIEVQLKRRYDLIPNLVETVKGYTKHENEAFENMTKARAAALGAQSVGEKQAADNLVTSALKSIFAIAEAYPDLKAIAAFANLQNELTDTENKVQAARRFYNTNVLELNNKIEMFPSNLIAGAFKFTKQEFFELDETEAAAKEPVQVKF